MSKSFEEISKNVKKTVSDVYSGSFDVAQSTSSSLFPIVHALNQHFSVMAKIFKDTTLKTSVSQEIILKSFEKFPDEFDSIAVSFSTLIKMNTNKQITDQLKACWKDLGDVIVQYLGMAKNIDEKTEFKVRCEFAKTSFQVSLKSVALMELVNSCSDALKIVQESSERLKKIMMNVESALLASETGSLTENKSSELIVPTVLSQQIQNFTNSCTNSLSNIISGHSQDSILANNLPILLKNIDMISQKAIGFAIFLGVENQADQLACLQNIKSVIRSYDSFIESVKSCCDVDGSSKDLQLSMSTFLKTFEEVGNRANSKVSLGKSIYTLKASLDTILEPKYIESESSGTFQIKSPQDLSRTAKKISEISSALMKAANEKNKAEIESIAAKSLSELLNFIDQIRVYYTSNADDENSHHCVKNTRECMKKLCKMMETCNTMIASSNDTEYKKVIIQLNKEITESSVSLAKSTASFREISKDGRVVVKATELAKMELEKLVKSMEAALSKLSGLKPSYSTGDANTDKDLALWGQQILETSKVITGAVKTLVSTASGALSKVTGMEEVASRVVSSARLVSESSDGLTEAVAKVLKNEEGSRDFLAESAKNVADSTSRLISALQGGLDSRSFQSLEAAGVAVKQATEVLAHSIKNIERSTKKMTNTTASDSFASEELALMEIICQKESAFEEAKQLLAYFEDKLKEIVVKENSRN